MEEDDTLTARRFEVHEGIVFAIELTDSLHFINASTGHSHLYTILNALQDAMAHSAITLPNTGYGCYLFNGVKTTAGNKSGVEKLFPLRDLNVKSMKVVHDILSDAEEKQDPDAPYIPLEQRFKPRNNVDQSENPLFDMLITLQDEFLVKKEGQKIYNIKKIFLFTDNDSPVEVDNFEHKNVIRQVCKDLDDSLVTIIPFFLTSEHRPFTNTLYSELMFLPLQDDNGGLDMIFDGPSTKPITVSAIETRILRRKEIKRIQFQVPLIIRLGGQELIIGVKGYAVMSHEKPTANKWLWESESGRKNVHSMTRRVDSKTGMEFDKTIRGYPVGLSGDLISMDKEQLESLEKYDDEHVTFLKLVGTKDERSGIKSHYVTGRSTFVVPSEDDYEGSTRTLSALYASLKKQRKVGILFGKLRKGGQPFFYALQYTDKKVSSDSKIFSPEGFYLHRLAYFEDVRQCPQAYYAPQEPNEALKMATKTVMADMMAQFGSEYVAREVKNPTLNHHYRTIKEFKLQVEVKKEDQTLREKLLDQDDTLKKLDDVRTGITESQFEGKTQLYEHLEQWNAVFGRV